MPRFSVGVEFFVEADTPADACTIVGEFVGMNWPEEIDDLIVQDAERAADG